MIASLYSHLIVRDPRHPSIERRVPRHELGLDCQCREHKAEPAPRRPNPSAAERQVMAARAGAQGKSAKPMGTTQRQSGYERQNHAAGRRPSVTARQRRQIERQGLRVGVRWPAAT